MMCILFEDSLDQDHPESDYQISFDLEQTSKNFCITLDFSSSYLGVVYCDFIFFRFFITKSFAFLIKSSFNYMPDGLNQV